MDTFNQSADVIIVLGMLLGAVGYCILWVTAFLLHAAMPEGRDTLTNLIRKGVETEWTFFALCLFSIYIVGTSI